MAPDAAIQSRRNIVPVHKTENVLLSTIFWAIPILGLACEILMATAFRSPYGMTVGVNLEQYSMNKPEHNMTAGTYIADHLQRIEAVGNMPFLLYSNFKASPMRGDSMNFLNRYFDSSNSEWENPFAKNTRMGVGVVCNPSFNFERMMSSGAQSTGAHFMQHVYNKGILRDSQGQVIDDQIWYNMRRADFVIGEGMVSFTDTKYMEEDYFYDFWLRYRECIVNAQTATLINTSSVNYAYMKHYGLIHSDILPASNYKTIMALHPSQRPKQNRMFLFKYHARGSSEELGTTSGVDITADVMDDSIPFHNITTCVHKKSKPKAGTECRPMSMDPEDDKHNAKYCTCGWKSDIEDYVYKVDKYQMMMNTKRNMNRLPVQLAARMHNKIAAFFHLVKSLASQIILLVIFGAAFYSPSPKFGGVWLFNRWIIRLIALNNIMTLNNKYLKPISNEFGSFCFKRHPKSDDAARDTSDTVPGVQLMKIPSLPGLECEWAPGINLLAWQIILNWMYLIVTFFWRSQRQNIDSMTSIYEKIRYPLTANRRGVYPVSFVGIITTISLIAAVGYGDGFQTVRHYAVNGYQRTKIENVEKQGCDKGSIESCILQGYETDKYIPVNAYEWPTLFYLCWRSVPTFWKTIPSCAAIYLIYFLSTPFNGVMTNKLQKIHSTRPRLVMISLAALLPYYFIVVYSQTFNVHIEEHVNLPFGINFKISTPTSFDGWNMFAAKFLVADVPRYLVVFLALATIGEALNTQIYFTFKVISYAIYTGMLVFLTAMFYWNTSCDFGYTRSRVHNHALSAYTDPEASYPKNFLAGASDLIATSTSLSGKFNSQGLCKAGLGAQSWIAQIMSSGGAPALASQRLKLYYNQFRMRKMVLAPMIYVPDGNDRTNMTHSAMDAEEWDSTYLVNVFMTLTYFSMQTVANAGLADISPSSVNECIFSIVLFLFSLFLVQNKFNNVLARMVNAGTIAKLGFTKNSQACLFVDSTAESRHRIQHTSSLLWRYWELWRGICPHSDISTDFDLFPRSVRQEVSYMVLEELCCRNKSMILSKLSRAELKHISEGLNYHLLHSNDVLMNSLECQQFVLIIKSGDWAVCGLDDSEMVVEMDGDNVYFEKECLLGQAANYSVRCFSDYGECYTISRQVLVDAVFGSTNLSSITQVLGIDNATASILARQANHLEEFGLNLPAERADDVMSRPIVLSRQHLVINKYNDIENYKLETVRFLHNYESLLYFDKMSEDVRQLMYQHEMITSNSRLALRSADIRRQDYNMGHAFDLATELNMKSTDQTYSEFVKQMMGNLNADSEASSDSRHLSMKLDMMDHQADLDMDRNQGYMLELTPGTEELNTWGYFIAVHSIFAMIYTSYQWAFMGATKFNFTQLSTSDTFKNVLLFDIFGAIDLLIYLHCGFEDRTNSIAWNPRKVWTSMPIYQRIIRLLGGLPLGYMIWILFLPDLDQQTVTRAFRMMKVVYYYYVPAITLVNQGNKLYGTFMSIYLKTFLDILIIVVIISNSIYANSCSCQLDHRERFFLKGSCFAGSWAWSLFNEDTLLTDINEIQDKSPMKRMLLTLIWNWKVLTAFGSNNIVPSLSFTRTWLTALMFLGIVLLCKGIAVMCASSTASVRVMVLTEIKSHLLLVQERLQNSKFGAIVAQTKRQVNMQYGGFQLPGDFDNEDTLFPIDRIFMKAESFKAYLSHIQLFIELPSEIQHHIAMSKNSYQYAANQVIIHEGDRVPSLFHLKLGSVEIRKNNECVGYLEAGNTINMLEMIGDVPSKYEYRTNTGCEIADWSREDLEHHMHTCWSPFTPALSRACADAAAAIDLKPFAYNVEALEKTQKDKAVKTLNDSGIVGEAVESDATISPESDEYLKFAFWNTVRILVNVCLSCYVSCIFHQKIAVCLVLVVLDLGGIYNMYMNSKLQRKDHTTNMYNKNAYYAKKFYMHNGLGFDCLTVILPLFIDVFTGWNNNYSFVIRSFQMMHVKDYFTWDATKVQPQVMAEIYMHVCRHIWIISFASAVGMGVSTYEALTPVDDDTAGPAECVMPLGGDMHNPKYCFFGFFNHGKQVLRDPVFNYGFFINDDDRFDRVSIPFGSKTQATTSGGWLNQIYSMSANSNNETLVAAGGSNFAFGGVDFTNTWHIFCAVFYYWANCATNTGGSVIYPIQNSFSQWVELFFQLYGMLMVVNICTAFTTAGEIIDARRSAVEQTFYKLCSYLNNILQGQLDKGIISRIEHQYNMNFEKNTANIEQQVFNGLPPCLKQEVCRDLYGDILTKKYLKDASEQQIRELAVHVQTVATLPGKFINQGQITDQAFFIADGMFTVNGEPLPQGSCVISRGSLCCSEIVSLDEGIIYTIPLATIDKHHNLWSPNTQMAYGVSKPDTGCVAKENEVSYHTYFGFVGIWSWVMAMANVSRFGFSQDYSDNLVKYDVFLAIVMFIWTHYNFWKSKGADYLKFAQYSKTDKAALIAALPLPYAPIGFLNRLGYFYVEHVHIYSQAWKQLETNIYYYRIVKFTIYNLCICTFINSLHMYIICPSKDKCELENSMLIDLNDYSGKLISNTNATTGAHVTATFAVAERKSSDFLIFIQLFYSTIDSFTSTGFGNIMPRMPVNMLLRGLTCWIGRIYFGVYLGLGGDILATQIDAVHSEYLLVRQRIENYLIKSGLNRTRFEYVCSVLDAQYQKTRYLDIKATLQGSVMMPALRRQFYDAAMGATVKASAVFKGVTDDCVAEICERALNIEHYFSGNVIQEARTPFLGTSIILDGSCTVNSEEVMVDGDTIYGELMFKDCLASYQVQAFTDCEVMRVDKKALDEVLEFFPDDRATVMRNIEQL